MVGAGASAREEYARRAASATGRHWLGVAAAAIVAGAGAGGGVLILAWLAGHLLLSISARPVPGAFTREAAITAALAAAVHTSVRRAREHPDTASWAAGAAGEQRVGAALAALEPAGWQILHDRRVPRSSANIDHIAVGPAGVWVIETKSWQGQLEVGASQLRLNGRPVSAVYDQVWREAAAVRAAVGGRYTVRAVVCVDRGRVTIGRDAAGRPVRGPVEFHTPASLVRRLEAAPSVLAAPDVERIVTALDRGLPPATARAGPPAAPGSSAPSPRAPPRANATTPSPTKASG